MNATTKDLMNVEGLGKVSVEEIRKVLGTTYEAKA